MPTIKFIDPEGAEHVIKEPAGKSLMEVAVANSVPGIDGDCGGACACATCHIYVDEAWREATGTPAFMEESMLDFAEHVRPESRLACQIRLTEALDGIVVRVAPR